MLSSPAAPPDPDPEEARLAALPSQAKILYPLEWACLKARQKKWDDEDADGLSACPLLRRCREVDDGGAEPELINNLESGAVVSPQNDAPNLNWKNALFSHLSMMPQFEDVEAAITLLGFKTRS
jgi:hypothetical protein